MRYIFVYLIVLFGFLTTFINGLCEIPENGLCHKDIVLGNKISGKNSLLFAFLSLFANSNILIYFALFALSSICVDFSPF
jgi:hypothetical protein